MKPTLTLFLTAALALSACGWRDSRLNPGNWFGSAEPAAIDENTNPLVPVERTSLLRRAEAEDRSVLIANITKLQIERTTTGAIVLVEGVASRQGAYGAELRPVNDDLVSEDGVLDLEFRVIYPQANTQIGSTRSREVIDAYSLTTQQLNGVRLVRVRAEQNALESRRR